MNADQFYKEVENYLVIAYSKPPSDSAELGRLLTEKGVDSSTRSSLLKKISEHN